VRGNKRIQIVYSCCTLQVQPDLNDLQGVPLYVRKTSVVSEADSQLEQTTEATSYNRKTEKYSFSQYRCTAIVHSFPQRGSSYRYASKMIWARNRAFLPSYSAVSYYRISNDVRDLSM
jgi:hypothetical protein